MDKNKGIMRSDLGKKIKSIIPYGSISMGADYGFLPYTVNMPSPASAFNTQGQLGLDVLGIPLDATFFYSSQKNLIGLNNYFRISYNAERYKDKLNSNLSRNLLDYKNQLGPLYNKRQSLTQKMAYLDYLINTNPEKWAEIEKGNQIKELNIYTGVQDTLNKMAPNSIPQLPLLNKDSLAKTPPELPVNTYSLNNQNKIDSIKGLYNQYKEDYENINSSITKINKSIEQIESVTKGNNKAYLTNNSLFTKAQNILSGVQKFEIGLCYPNNSTFLVNNMPIRGINVEYSKNNKYLAFTYGTTVSTLLYNNVTPEGILKNVRNSYNYFDFNNISAGRKILSIKGGVGSKETNHFFAGILLGQGKDTYILSEGSPTGKKESNMVLEIDGRYKITSNTILDVTLGKSSIMSDILQYDLIKNALNEIFSSFRSNAGLIKIASKVRATKTNLSLSVRVVDPFFKSYGIGFIRSDNMRYELKCDQPITSKMKYTGMLRFEEDNLLRIMNYTNKFYSFNNTISLKIRRGLMLRASYTPLYRNLSSENYNLITRNSITSGVVTFSPKINKTSLQMNAIYSYYIVNTDTQQINFKNFSYTQQLTFRKGIKTSFSLSWFKNNLRDSLNNNIFLIVADIGYQFKNGSSATIAGKTAYKLNEGLYPGFIAKLNVKLFKTLFWENHLEKFIVGDLFNGYNKANLQAFPYYCNTKLVYNF